MAAGHDPLKTIGKLTFPTPCLI